MFITILIYLLSNPGELILFGVLGEFKTQSECVQKVATMDVPEDTRKKLACMEIRKPVEI